MEKILEIKNLSYTYHSLDGETQALKNISFGMEEGEFLSVVGPSGCGKSTLLSIICGLLTPDFPAVSFHGRPLKENNNKIGYMLQHDHLFEWRTIYQNVLLGLEIQHKLSVKTKEKAKKLLEIYGLKEFSNAKPSELSGGMRQRAALVRTLVLEPELLLLDEPFSALDYQTRLKVGDDAKPSELSGGMRQRAALVRTLVLEPELLLLDEPFSALDYQTRLKVGDDIGQIIRKEKKTAILVTHDLSEAISLGDRVLILSKRPASIQKTVPLHFDLETDTPLQRRNTSEFKDYFNLIWKELNKND